MVGGRRRDWGRWSPNFVASCEHASTFSLQHVVIILELTSMRTTYMQRNGKSHGRQGRVSCVCETKCSHLSMTLWHHPLWNLHSLYIYGLILKGVYFWRTQTNSRILKNTNIVTIILCKFLSCTVLQSYQTYLEQNSVYLLDEHCRHKTLIAWAPTPYSFII